MDTCVVVDLEMTGLNFKTDRSLEIGAVKLEEGNISSIEALGLLDSRLFHATNAHPVIIAALLGAVADTNFKILTVDCVQNTFLLQCFSFVLKSCL